MRCMALTNSELQTLIARMEGVVKDYFAPAVVEELRTRVLREVMADLMSPGTLDRLVQDEIRRQVSAALAHKITVAVNAELTTQ